MTRFGKILVLLNLGLAVMLAAWAFNIYANGIDWSNPKTGPFAIRKDKLEKLWKGVDPVQSDWLNDRSKLADEETRLVAERVRYDQELRYVLEGPAKGKWVLEIAVAAKDDPKIGVKKGQVLLDQQGYPQLMPVRDPNNVPLQLLSLAEYNDEDDRILKEIGLQIAMHAAQIAEANGYTDKIIGNKDKGIRGFQQRINDEQAKDADVLAEIKLVEPQLINTLVEAQLINKRHTQMMRRIEELRKVSVAGK